MHRKLWMTLAVGLVLALSLMTALTVAAMPPAPGDTPTGGPSFDLPVALPGVEITKPNDEPNPIDYARNQERQRLLEAGLTAEANALAVTGSDRVLVILVEYAGTDSFTWTAPITPGVPSSGSRWDPYGRANQSEAVLDASGNTVVGDCSKIITQTTVFTYTGPLHNQIPQPISQADASGASIWYPDASPAWYQGFMFGNGVTLNYTRTDGSVVNEDFTGKSLRNYYYELSNGQYEVQGDIVGWVQVPHSTQWYGTDTCPGARSVPTQTGPSNNGAIPGAGNNRSLVQDALKAVNAISNTIPGFSWKNYDQNGDGVIDRLWIVHAGYGEEDNTTLMNRTPYGESSIWSHSSSLSPAFPVGEGITARSYIMMPESGGISVFTHEYGHNLGAADLYAYSYGNVSAGFWTEMSDSWEGYPLGFLPTSMDPWHLDNWGWLNPVVITDTTKEYVVTLGQTSNFPGGDGVYRGAKIQLEDGALPTAAPVWQGQFYWWGGKQDATNSRMTARVPIALPAGAPASLSFDMAYDLELNYDYLYVQVSLDNGTTWQTVTNTVGIANYTGKNAKWPKPNSQVFDLSAFASKSILLRFYYVTDANTLGAGPFVDSVLVKSGDTILLADDAEDAAASSANWTYRSPWQRNNGAQTFTQNFYLQWRNTGKNGGYDSALGDPRFRYGPVNTGLVVWYNNNFYSDNEVYNHLVDRFGWGSKGRMLVVDAHPEPYRDPYYTAMGFNNEGANVPSRSLMRDAPFSLWNSVDFGMTIGVYTPTQFTGRPAVSSFHDSMGYYPGAEYVSRGPGYPADDRKWVTKQWDASVVMPAKAPYGVKAPGYTGSEEWRFKCAPITTGVNAGKLSCTYYPSGLGAAGTTGNPGDVSAQYGWHVQILSQTDVTATVKIWNAQKDANLAFDVDKTEAQPGDVLKYTFNLKENWGSPLDLFACAPLDPALETYVPGSATGDAVPLPMPCEAAATLAAQQPSFMTSMATAAAFEVRAIGWTANVPTAGQGTFSFKVQVKPQAGVEGRLVGEVALYDQGQPWRDVMAPVVTVTPPVVYNTPVTVVFGVVQDSFIDGGLPNSNYGGWGQLFVRSDDLVRTLYQFDLSSINSLYPVDKATLSVYVDGYSGGGSPAKLQAFEVTTAWNQGTVTWKLPWTLAGGDFVGAVAGSAAVVKEDVGSWKQIDITALVQKWVTAPAANHGALIRLREFTSFTGYRLTSSKYWVPSDRPKLEVQYRKP